MLPNPEDLLALEPDELAGFVIEHFNKTKDARIHSRDSGRDTPSATISFETPEAFNRLRERVTIEGRPS
jgi:hypothetical protein